VPSVLQGNPGKFKEIIIIMMYFKSALLVAVALFVLLVGGILLNDAYGESELHTYPGHVTDICYEPILDQYPEIKALLCPED
jgi:surface polysaccharide O-acyltransferase-like enzyme